MDASPQEIVYARTFARREDAMEVAIRLAKELERRILVSEILQSLRLPAVWHSEDFRAKYWLVHPDGRIEEREQWSRSP